MIFKVKINDIKFIRFVGFEVSFEENEEWSKLSPKQQCKIRQKLNRKLQYLFFPNSTLPFWKWLFTWNEPKRIDPCELIGESIDIEIGV